MSSGAHALSGLPTSATIPGSPFTWRTTSTPNTRESLVQAWAEILDGPIAPSASMRLGELTRRLSLRYLGPNGPGYAERTIHRPRVLVRLRPTRWRTWTGREWHPRYW